MVAVIRMMIMIDKRKDGHGMVGSDSEMVMAVNVMRKDWLIKSKSTSSG